MLPTSLEVVNGLCLTGYVHQVYGYKRSPKGGNAADGIGLRGKGATI